MSKAKLGWKQWLLRSATVLAAVAVPAAVWAYAEGTHRGRLVKSGSGCIMQLSSVTHSDDHGAFIVHGEAGLAGLALTGNVCTTDGRNRQIRGTHRLMTLWANKNAIDPNAAYDICTIDDKTHNWTLGSMKFDKTWNAPPCGEGWYALVYCMTDVDTYMQTNNGVRLGWFNSGAATVDCNISPNWHPAIHGIGGERGPAVSL